MTSRPEGTLRMLVIHVRRSSLKERNEARDVEVWREALEVDEVSFYVN